MANDNLLLPTQFDHVDFKVQNFLKRHSQKIQVFFELMKSTNVFISKSFMAISSFRMIADDDLLLSTQSCDLLVFRLCDFQNAKYFKGTFPKN